MSITLLRTTVPPLPGLACFATSTHRVRLEDSQDAVARACLPATGYPALLLADGLGSFGYAGEAARFVVQTAQTLLEGTAMPNISPTSIRDLFFEVQARLTHYVDQDTTRQNVGETPDPAHSWGTTLLMAAETPEALMVAYAGNGGLFHLRGNFAEAGAELRQPWNCVNLLNPHSIYEDGREALTRYLAAVAPADQVEPTILQIRKDLYQGDLLLLCTDGLFSQDQVRYGDPGDDSLWGEVSRPLRAVYQTLRACFRAEAPLTAGELQQGLQTTLATMREQRELDDDTTLGLLVTAQALAYHQKREKT